MTSMNLFTSARVIPTKQPRPKTPTPTIELDGLGDYAAIVAVERALKSLKERARRRLDDSVSAQFTADGIRTQKCPKNFRGRDGDSRASCELRRRSTASALNDEEVALLDEYRLPHEELAGHVETFVINPLYASDAKLLGRVSRALSNVRGLPSDFIMAQQGSKKTVVSEESFDRVFTLGESAVRALMRVVFVVGVKPTATPEIESALSRVGQIFREEESDERQAV